MSAATEALSAILEAAKVREDREPRYGFSDAHGCLRAAVLAFRHWAEHKASKVTIAPLRWQFSSWAGTDLGDRLEEIGRRLGFETQVPCKLPNEYGLEITGNANLVGPDFVGDFKRCGDSAWRAVQKEPKPEHRQQVNSYAVALGKPRWALFYLRHLNKGEEVPVVVHEGDTDPSEAAKTIRHWLNVDNCREMGLLPRRELPADSFECRVCSYSEECEAANV